MVTLKDIAERVGVSITTVSRVLNGKGSISQETKDKVFQVMRELNYYPNEMARSLVNKNSHIIGLIVPYIDHPFFSALTAAIEEASSHAGYKLFLCISGGNQERELEQFAALQANNVAGVLVCTRDSHNMDELLNRRNIPLVSIERSIEGVPSVACDNYKGGVLAAQELLASGCKAPLLFGNRIVSSRIPAFGRYQGFFGNLPPSRLPLQCVLHGSRGFVWQASGRGHPPRPRAVSPHRRHLRYQRCTGRRHPDCLVAPCPGLPGFPALGWL